jgi:hypothetical protein
MLSTDKFFAVLAKYPTFLEKVQALIIQTIGNRDNSIALDYIPGNTTFHHNGRVMKDDEALHIQRIILKLKNAIMYYIVRNREQRKVPKLSDIL